MNSASKITNQIILDSFSSLKNLQNISSRHLTFNPFLYQTSNNPLYPLIAYNLVVKKDIDNFGSLLVKHKLGPPIFRCEPLQNIFVATSSYIPSSNSFEETYFHQKWSKAAEGFNSSLRELNQHQLQEKQVRQNLVKARNNIENCIKEMKQKSSQGSNQNQTLSKVLSYIL